MNPNAKANAATAAVKNLSGLSLLRPMSPEHHADYIETPHGNLVRRFPKFSKRAKKQLATVSRRVK